MKKTYYLCNVQLKNKKKNMKIYLLQERYKWSNNVIFASENLDKVIDIVKQKYKIDDEDIQYLIEWKEFYNILEDVKITIEEIELDKLVTYY